MIVHVHVGCMINHSSTVINLRRRVVACCFVWNLLVRTMRPFFSGKASLGLAQGNREEGSRPTGAHLAVLLEEHKKREACTLCIMDQS